MVILLAVVMTQVAQTIVGRFGETPIPDRLISGGRPIIGGRLDVIQKNAQCLGAAAVGILVGGILNPSICFLISLAKAAAPAPFTTR